MHKKKKSKGHGKHHRRHRVGRAGGINLNSPAIKLLGVAAGYFLTAGMVNEGLNAIVVKPTKDPTSGANIPGVVPETTNTILTVAEVGIGGFLLMRKQQNLLTFVLGSVAAGAGIKRALKKFGVIKGYQSVPVIGKHRMAGYQSVPVIGVTPPQLAGTPAQLQGYRVNGGTQYGYNSQGSGVMGSAIKPDATGSGMMSGAGYLG